MKDMVCALLCEG